MRGLEREEEDLEEAVSHISIYLRGLDQLYEEQAQQLKQQIDRAERAEQRIELERIKTTMTEVELHNTKLDLLSTYVLTPVLLTILHRRIPIIFPKTSSRSLPYTQPCLCTQGPYRKLSWCGTLRRLWKPLLS
jgi:hypothetical protein